MTGILAKEEIIIQLNAVCKEFADGCSTINDQLFFRQPADKWSIAQDVRHLITSADTTRLAFSLPKFIVRWYTGKPNRPSRTYDELVAKYQLKLQQGGRAGGRFVPKLVEPKISKEKQLQTFEKVMKKLVHTIEKKWDDALLDKYLAPHPLLGKITLRELGYFTIYHTRHHLAIIQKKITA